MNSNELPRTNQKSGHCGPSTRPLLTALPAAISAKKTARATEPQKPFCVLIFISSPPLLKQPASLSPARTSTSPPDSRQADTSPTWGGGVSLAKPTTAQPASIAIVSVPQKPSLVRMRTMTKTLAPAGRANNAMQAMIPKTFDGVALSTMKAPRDILQQGRAITALIDGRETAPSAERARKERVAAGLRLCGNACSAARLLEDDCTRLRAPRDFAASHPHRRPRALAMGRCGEGHWMP